MKKLLFTGLMLTVIMFNSCVQYCIETEKKFDNSTKSYPDLVPVKVDAIKTKSTQDNSKYKIIYIYEVCDNLFGKYISQTIIPQTKKDNNNIEIYAIASNCGWLKGIKPEFEKYNINLTPYYIHDNSLEYILYKNVKNIDRPDNRITRIAKNLFTNTDKMDKILTNNTCFVVNSDNKIKLARYTCNTKQGEKSVVIPCPIEKITEPLDKIDFDAITEIKQEANVNDYIYIIYFQEYDR